MKIYNYDDFVLNLLNSGFSLSGGNSDGIFSLITWSWKETPPYETPVRWHTGDMDTDPWEWRVRVLNERNDIAYSKLFFGKGGYITKQWYPYFLAARRKGKSFTQDYMDGNISNFAKRIYDCLSEHGTLPLQLIKQFGNFSKEEKSKFDRALTELQMKMYITMCGTAQKTNKFGEEYGWSSTVFCRAEEFWSKDIFKIAQKISEDEAAEEISAQIYKLNPNAQEKKVMKFIKGI